MARALLSTVELDALEGLVRQHLRVQRRLEELAGHADLYDARPAELRDLEAEEKRLRVALVRTLRGWLGRFELPRFGEPPPPCSRDGHANPRAAGRPAGRCG